MVSKRIHIQRGKGRGGTGCTPHRGRHPDGARHLEKEHLEKEHLEKFTWESSPPFFSGQRLGGSVSRGGAIWKARHNPSTSYAARFNSLPFASSRFVPSQKSSASLSTSSSYKLRSSLYLSMPPNPPKPFWNWAPSCDLLVTKSREAPYLL